MTEHQEPKQFKIPGWVWPFVVAVTSIIASTLWAITYLDNRYATKADVAVIGVQLTGVQLVMIPVKVNNLSPTPTQITVYVLGHQ